MYGCIYYGCGSTNVVVCMFMVGSRRRSHECVCVAGYSNSAIAIKLLLLICKMWYNLVDLVEF